MKNSWDDWWDNFLEWWFSSWNKIIWGVKEKVYWVYFIESTYNSSTGVITEEHIYSTLSEEDYKKVVETKHTINTQNCVDVSIKGSNWITQKTLLLVDKIHLIN